MRFVDLTRFRLFATAAVLAVAAPLLGQDAPESILPPGFGDPVEDTKPAPSRDDGPQDLLPSSGVRSPTTGDTSSQSGSSSSAPSTSGSTGSDATSDEDKKEGDEELAPPVLQDLPPHARRSTANVGVLAVDDGDMGPQAFGVARGAYLEHLMRVTSAPIASRWASITLRRALLSRVDTPSGANGADFAAERAWLLLRMGEADASRLLVQAVDADQYTPWMKTVAMQASLASADPAGICPAAEGHPAAGKDAYWMMARGICSAFAGESALASALVDQVGDRGKTPRIDVLLAEKVVGAAGNSRRSVNILWEDVDRLTAWRFGLASATAVKIPDPLLATTGPHVRAWRARAPLLSATDRLPDAEIAAALGVFSSAALVDHYAQVAQLAEEAGQNASGAVDGVGQAFGADTPDARVSAMEALWNSAGDDALARYARQIATARAAASLPVSGDHNSQLDGLIASMMSAGLDVQAARWAKQVSSGSLAWGLLAVGSPERMKDISSGAVSGFDTGESGRRAQFLLAGLAGLGRLDPQTASSVAEDLGVPLGRENVWTKALDRAVAGREPATVALLSAVGLQGTSWASVSPAHLFRVVSALRRVGLEGEARMIAAEALMRS